MEERDRLDPAMAVYYERGRERDRLARPKGELELVRTQEILLRALPAAPALVADIGGGPGRYATWLAELGHEVEHRDLMPLHVEQLRSLDHGRVRSDVGDARDLDLDDSSVDAVLLLGPLYHLRERDDRVQALREARRVVRPGGPVLVAVISRWAPRLDGALQERLYEQYPEFLSELPGCERSGDLPPVEPGAFLGRACLSSRGGCRRRPGGATGRRRSDDVLPVLRATATQPGCRLGGVRRRQGL